MMKQLMYVFWNVSLVFAVLLLLVFGRAEAQVSTSLNAGDFTIVAIPDTQYYVGNNSNLNNLFKHQMQWIINHRTDPKYNIKLVLGLGDIVDNGDDTTQWSKAVNAVSVLDGYNSSASSKLPYVFAIGNHDVNGHTKKPFPRTASSYAAYFGPSRYTSRGYSWYKMTYPSTSGIASGSDGANSFSVVNINGTNYGILSLEFYPRKSVLDWANSIISTSPYSNMQIIVIMHAYLFPDGSSPGTAHRTQSGDSDSAHSYCLAVSPGSMSPTANCSTWAQGYDGIDMWNNYFSKHKNIVLILNGHFRLPFQKDPNGKEIDCKPLPSNGTGYLSVVNSFGTRVNQMVSDYQGQGWTNSGTATTYCDAHNWGYFGNGYLRIYRVRPSIGKIEAYTYSPSADSTNGWTGDFTNAGIPVPPPWHGGSTDAFNQFTVPYSNPFAGSTSPSPTPSAKVSMTSPVNGGTYTNPVHVHATYTGSPYIKIYVNGSLAAQSATNTYDGYLTMPVGSSVRVRAEGKDASGNVIYSDPAYITVK